MRFVRSCLILAAVATPIATLSAQAPNTDSLDAFITTQMARRQIAGLSLAIIQDGRIAYAHGYGVADRTTKAPVTTATLFQAGSISKPVAAVGALRLVEAGKLSLDDPVNRFLTSWKVPDNRFTAQQPVTLRRLVSHSAGMTVHGFPGYNVAEPKPTLVQVLDGSGPSNTPAIRVDTTPGAIWRYSGGGFTVMQQMMIDVTGTPFPQLMQESVLGPIGMTASSYEQPQPPARAALTASGYYADRTPVRGRWHVYPEMAAAGLWTTATDLAKFAIEIQQTLDGRGHHVISEAMARRYLTEENGGSGLGIVVHGTGRTLRFNHGGRDEGFDAQLMAFAGTGQGVAIMLNANDNSGFVGRVIRYIGQMYGWPDSGMPAAPAATHGVRVEAARLDQLAGYYEFQENNMITLVPAPDGTGLQVLVDGLPDETFFAVDRVTFGSDNRPVRISFAADRPVTGLEWTPPVPGAAGRHVAKVAPLPSTMPAVRDPDLSVAARIVGALRALREGGAVLQQAAGVTAGAKRDFAGGVGIGLDGLDAMTFLGAEDVSGRGIHRHDSEVARVRYYRLGDGSRFLLVHLTADGMVTDLDVVMP